jgi:hypothetical protein
MRTWHTYILNMCVFVLLTRKVLKCGTGEGWRWVAPIVWEMKYYREWRRRGMGSKQYREGRLTGFVTSCLWLPSKTRQWRKYTGKKWREDEEEDVSSYRMTPRKIKCSETEEGVTRSHCLENSLWKAEYRTNEGTNGWMKENTNELSNVYSKTHDVPLQNSVHIN